MVQLVILGFLKERDYHGYELKKEIQKRMAHWTDIKFGSIYHALKMLVDHESVEKVKTQRQNSRPDKTIYRITKKGEEDFKSQLREELIRIQRTYLAFNVGIYFAENLPKNEVQEILTKRIAEYEEMFDMLVNVQHLVAMADVSKVKEAIMKNAIYHVEAELKWLKEIKDLHQKEKLYQ